MFDKQDEKIVAKTCDEVVFTAPAESIRAIPKTIKRAKRARLLSRLCLFGGALIQAVFIVLGISEILNIFTTVSLSLTLIGLVGALTATQLSDI